MSALPLRLRGSRSQAQREAPPKVSPPLQSPKENLVSSGPSHFLPVRVPLDISAGAHPNFANHNTGVPNDEVRRIRADSRALPVRSVITPSRTWPILERLDHFCAPASSWESIYPTSPTQQVLLR